MVAKAFNSQAKEHDRLYDGSGWRSFRRRFLSINDQCYACGGKSDVVDHLVPHKGDENLFKKIDNLIPLCSTCHNIITAKFDMHYRPGDSIAPKVEWLSAKRGTQEWTPKKIKVVPWTD